ncbi:MAG: hypothetical protein QM638_13440, partial [Nocardioides sp.]
PAGPTTPPPGTRDISSFPPPIGRTPIAAPPPAAAQPSSVARPAERTTGEHGAPTQLGGTGGTPPGGRPVGFAAPAGPAGPVGPPGPTGPAPLAGPPRRRRRKAPLIVAVTAAVVLVAAGVAVWAYTSGKLGFGPLSGEDKAAAAALAADIHDPSWASRDQVACATDELLHQTRASDLADQGLITKDADAEHGWDYTEKWRTDTATAYLGAVLDCSADWADELGKDWHLESTSCLHDIGADDLSAYFAKDLFDPSDGDSLDGTSAAVVKKLDGCYATKPSKPDVTTAARYRAVAFDFTRPSEGNGETTLQVKSGSSWQTLNGTSYTLGTDEGGDRACLPVRTVTSYGWGTTEPASARACGHSKPAQLWWTKDKVCNAKSRAYYNGPCYTWSLRYAGLQPFTTYTLTLSQNGGDCDSYTGSCSHPIFTTVNGRGRIAHVWSAQPSWHEHFEAELGKLTAVLDN